MKKALLVIDIQNDFCKNGSLEIDGADGIIPVVNRWIGEFKQNGNLIVATKDWHPVTHKSFAINSNGKIGEIGELNGLQQVWWPVHCVQNSYGAEFHKELNTMEIDRVVYKGENIDIDSYSAFFDNGKRYKTELDTILKSENIEEIYVVGLATDYCVKYSVLDALELGYKVNVILKGCKGVNLNPNDCDNAVEEMENKGAIIIK